MYKIGYPFWKFVMRMGVPFSLWVNVTHDREADVFIATSEDLPGLVCEALTMDELVADIGRAVNDLLAELIHDGVTRRAIALPRLETA